MIIGNQKAKIVDKDKFESIVKLSDLILIDNINNTKEAYGDIIYNKDQETNDTKAIKKSKGFNNKNNARIDLHIEKINPHYLHMDNIDIIKNQLDYCQTQIELAIHQNKESIDIIHGIGEGVLRKEVHKIIQNYNLSYFESNDRGSTKIIL